jgi:hypothetical protein
MTTIGVGVGMAGGSVTVGVGVVVGVAVAPSSFGVCSGVLRAGVSVEVGVAVGEDVSVPVAVAVGMPVGVGVSREEASVGEAAISGVTVSVDGGARVSVEVVIGMLDAVAPSFFGVCSGVLRAGVEATTSVGVSVGGTSVTAGRGASVGAAVGEGAPMSVAEGTGIGGGSVVSAEAGRLPAKNKKPPPSANKSASEAVREDRLSAQSGPRSCTDLSPGSARRVGQRVLQESGFVNGDPLDILSDRGRIAALLLPDGSGPSAPSSAMLAVLLTTVLPGTEGGTLTAKTVEGVVQPVLHCGSDRRYALSANRQPAGHRRRRW